MSTDQGNDYAKPVFDPAAAVTGSNVGGRPGDAYRNPPMNRRADGKGFETVCEPATVPVHILPEGPWQP